MPPLSSRVSKVMANHRFWLVVALFALGVVLHYPQQILGTESSSLLSSLGLTRHAVERVFLLLPVTYVGLVFGLKAGLASLGVALAIMLPRAIWVSSSPPDAIFESVGIIIIGGVVNLWFHFHRRDIARRKSAEAMLTKIIDGSSIPAFVVNKQHVVTHWNTALESLSAIKKGEIIGTDEQWRAFYPEKRPVMADLIVDGVKPAKIAEHYGGKYKKSGLIKGAYEAEDWFPALGGEGRWLHFTASPIQNDLGQVIGAIETLEDVTERKQAEEELRRARDYLGSLLQYANAPIIVWDRDQRITIFNTAFEQLTGYIAEEVVGQPLSMLFPEASRDESLTKIRQTLGGEYWESVEIPILLKDGESRIALWNSANIYDKDGKTLLATIAQGQDITERKSAEENLRYYLQEITKAQEEERRRIARELHDDTAQDLVVLSRELDSFVVSAINHLSVEDISYVERLRQQTEHILDGVHRFSQDLRPSVLDDLGLVPALEWLTSDLTEHFGIAVEMKVVGSVRRFPPEMELVVFRIAQEALRNVWKHSGTSKARVTLKFGDDKAVLTVEDEGKGFELPARIGDLTVAGKLGLAGMQERAQLIGGKLSLRSEPGKGTTLTLEIPV
ncbi:MAG: PAS domain S-box protein [Dehalococcoidia bacterium]|nr:MAG: PAS domain S-box protein [Dehalococcoidia bacterium]